MLDGDKTGYRHISSHAMAMDHSTEQSYPCASALEPGLGCKDWDPVLWTVEPIRIVDIVMSRFVYAQPYAMPSWCLE